MERGQVMGFARCAAARLRTWPFSRARWASRHWPASKRARLEIPNGTPVILDGSKGTLRLQSRRRRRSTRIRHAQSAPEARRKEDVAHAHEPAVTIDGTRIEVLANIGGLKDAEQVAELGGEGVGLLRSEFLFMERAAAPSEDEQFESYNAIAQAVGPERPVIIRTLDVGGDKPLAYLPIPEGGQSVPRRARHARRARPAGDPAHAAPRAAARVRLRARSA